MRYNASDISGLATLSRRRTNDFQSPPSTPSQRSNGFFGRGLIQSSSVADLHGMGNFPPQPQPNFHTVQQVKIFATASTHNYLLFHTHNVQPAELTLNTKQHNNQYRLPLLVCFYQYQCPRYRIKFLKITFIT